MSDTIIEIVSVGPQGPQGPIGTVTAELTALAAAASASATAAAASYDSFDDRYLGAKATAPTLDNDGNALLTGAIYWNTASAQMFVWSGSAWINYESTSVAASSTATTQAGIATTQATTATTQAETATTQASTATAQATIATTQATAASTARTAAEAARDAAFVNANIYADIATGRAAVADGQQFMVVLGDEIIRYRRNSATTQEELARYPTAQYIYDLLNPAPDLDGYVMELLEGHEQGLSMDATTDTLDLAVQVQDTTTPANNYLGNFQNFLPATSFLSPKLCRQADGSYRFQPHNNILYSSDLSDTSWTKTNSTITAGQIGPDGVIADACLLTATSTSSPTTNRNLGVLANRFYTHAYKVKAGTSAYCYISIINNSVTKRAWFNLNTGVFETVEAGLTTVVSSLDENGQPMGPGWYYIAAYHKTGSTNDNVRFGLSSADNSTTAVNGSTVLLTHVQVHFGIKRLDYLKTTTVAVMGIPYDWTNGERQIRFDVQTSYKGRSGDDFTNATFWTPSNVTPAFNAIGPHGEPCSTLTAGANGGTILQTVTSAGTVQIFSALVRRKTGTGTIEITVDNGATWKDVTADIGPVGGVFEIVWQRGVAANPTVGFRFGTSGDAVEVSMANVSTTTHVPPPTPSALLDYTASQDAMQIPFTRFPNAAAMTFYADIFMDPTSLSVVGGRSRVGFFGSGSVKSTVDIVARVNDFQFDHTVDNGTATTRSFGNGMAGRIQIQHRRKLSDHASAYDGNASYWNTLTTVTTLTHFGFGIAQSIWLRRALVVPEAISDDLDALRLFKLDRTAPNVNSNLLASAFVAKVVPDTTGILRIPGFEVLYERGDICEFITFWGQRNTTGYNLEAPQRMMSRRFQFDRLTNALTPLTDATVVNEPAGWATGAWGLQGYTPIKIKVGPYRGRLLLLYMQQDGSSLADKRNLYITYSDNNGVTWTTGVKFLDTSVFIGASSGFVATGENSTAYQLVDGPHEGRVYFSLNVNNQTHRAAWSDDFKVGGNGSGTNWSWSSTPVPNTGTPAAPGTFTEPAIASWPDGSIVMVLRNSGGGNAAYSISTDYGVTFSPASLINGDNVSWNTNCGLIQDDITGGFGRRGRLIMARSTSNGRLNHKVQSASDDNLTMGNNYRLFSGLRHVGYCPLQKAFADDNIYLCMAEVQPTVTSNLDTSQMIVAFRY